MTLKSVSEEHIHAHPNATYLINYFFVSGTCYVGNKDLTTLLTLVLIPQALYLVAGTGLLFLGCVFVVRKPRPLAAAPLTGAAPRKDNDLLGALCSLYLLPVVCVFASVCYEYKNRDAWMSGTDKPALWIFLLRYLMEVFIGVSAIFWIWSSKSVTAWRAVFRRLGPRKQLPVKCQTLPVLRYAPPTSSIQLPPATLSTSGSRHSGRSHSYRKPRIHHHRSGGETVL